jgi:2-keto-3-deoxy-6-phosphogluconate aldolase
VKNPLSRITHHAMHIKEKPMNEILQQLGQIKIIPVVVLEEAETAVPLAQALLDGGLPCAEVTFRTAAAAEAIRENERRLPALAGGRGHGLNRGAGAAGQSRRG